MTNLESEGREGKGREGKGREGNQKNSETKQVDQAPSLQLHTGIPHLGMKVGFLSTLVPLLLQLQ